MLMLSCIAKVVLRPSGDPAARRSIAGHGRIGVMSGHLFVVHGDLLSIACDALLIPSGTNRDDAGAVRSGHVTPAWLGELDEAVRDGFLVDAPDAQRPAGTVVARNGIRRPAVWAGFTGDRGDESLEFYTRVVDAFISKAGAGRSRLLELLELRSATTRV